MAERVIRGLVRLRHVPLVAAALVAAGCGAFEQPDAEYGGVCVDETTHVRLDDDACGDYDDEGRASHAGTYFMWISTHSEHHVPEKGRPVPLAIGARSVPAGTPIAKGLPTQGGAMSGITRGGFGAKAGTTVGIGGKAGGAGG